MFILNKTTIVLILTIFLYIPNTINAQAINLFGNELEELDMKYGQGKFNSVAQGKGTIWLLKNGSLRILFPGKEAYTITYDKLSKQLMKEKSECNHLTICLSEIVDANLETARSILQTCNDCGFWTIVVQNEEQLKLDYLQSYKYARIYSTNIPGIYELDHNSLTTQGSEKDIAEWVSILGVESLAFYPDKNMPWNHVDYIMSTQKKRGCRSFCICKPIDSEKLAIELKDTGFYQTTFIPSNYTIDNKQFTALQVENQLHNRLLSDCKKRSIKIISEPPIFFNPDNEMKIIDAIFKEDEFILVISRQGLGRNTWYKPDMNTKIIASGKDYKLIKDEGFEDFSCYPYNPDFGYSNGCLCWAPERGEIINTLHFEPIPIDVETIDMVGSREYSFYGIQLKKDNKYDNIEVINQTILFQTIELEGTKGGNNITVNRIELSDKETVICLRVLINADFKYKAYFGKDFEISLMNGEKIKPLRIESIPESGKDYIRAGDMTIESPRIVFPKIEERWLRNMTLKGNICHKYVNIPIGYSRPDPLMELMLSF